MYFKCTYKERGVSWACLLVIAVMSARHCCLTCSLLLSYTYSLLLSCLLVIAVVFTHHCCCACTSLTCMCHACSSFLRHVYLSFMRHICLSFYDRLSHHLYIKPARHLCVIPTRHFYVMSACHSYVVHVRPIIRPIIRLARMLVKHLCWLCSGQLCVIRVRPSAQLRIMQSPIRLRMCMHDHGRRQEFFKGW